MGCKGCHHRHGMNVDGVRWYVANSVSYGAPQEWIQEFGYTTVHISFRRWGIHDATRIE
jgi:hypothetical protein